MRALEISQLLAQLNQLPRSISKLAVLKVRTDDLDEISLTEPQVAQSKLAELGSFLFKRYGLIQSYYGVNFIETELVLFRNGQTCG